MSRLRQVVGLLLALTLSATASTAVGAGFAAERVERARLIGSLPSARRHNIPEATARLNRVVRVTPLVRPVPFTSLVVSHRLQTPHHLLSHAEFDASTNDYLRHLRTANDLVEVKRVEPRKGEANAVAHDRLSIAETPEAAKRPPAISPLAARVFRTALWTGMRTDFLVDLLGVTGDTHLNPRNAVLGGESELETYLRQRLKVADHDDVADSFGQNYPVRVGKLSSDVTLWRLFTDAASGSSPLGRYYFCCVDEIGAERWIDARGLATPPHNIKSDLAQVTIPKGTEVVIGPIADQNAFKALGGNVQIFVPHVGTFPYDHYKLKASGQSPTDIMVKADGNILRFGR